MSNIPLRACAICILVGLTTLLLAACGAQKQEETFAQVSGAVGQGSALQSDAAPTSSMGSTFQRVSDKIPQVSAILSLPTATPRYGEPTATRVVLINLLPTVTPTPVRLAGGYLGVVTTNQLNVRSAPNPNNEIIAKLDKQACVTLLENREGWYRIDMPSTEYGWVVGE